ncbi:hypothetical protein GGI00_005801 [Coemansia sp. RSA 2681]|nr:hypothetical protein GGI00_005801 [Coemansia sp. RSA 2681]
MPTDNKSTPTSDAISQPGKDTHVAEQSNARAEPPTWTELMQSRTTKATRRDDKTGQKDDKFTGNIRVCVSQEFHAALSDAGPSKALPILGKLTCFEVLSPKVARMQLLERRQQSGNQRGGWADVWYGRWLMRLQFTTILGLDHMKQTQELMQKSRLPTREAVRAVIGEDQERAAMFYVATVDEMMVKWPDNVAGFYRRMFTPNLKMGKRYVESWRSGAQQSMLGKFWDGAVSLSGLKLAATAFSNMAKAWDKENGGDKKED